ASLPARAIGAPIRPPVHLRECKRPPSALNGEGHIWLTVQDIGCSRSSRRRSFGYCSNSFVYREGSFRFGSFSTDPASLALRFMSAPLQKRTLRRRLWLPPRNAEVSRWIESSPH